MEKALTELTLANGFSLELVLPSILTPVNKPEMTVLPVLPLETELGTAFQQVIPDRTDVDWQFRSPRPLAQVAKPVAVPDKPAEVAPAIPVSGETAVPEQEAAAPAPESAGDESASTEPLSESVTTVTDEPTAESWNQGVTSFSWEDNLDEQLENNAFVQSLSSNEQNSSTPVETAVELDDQEAVELAAPPAVAERYDQEEATVVVTTPKDGNYREALRSTLSDHQQASIRGYQDREAGAISDEQWQARVQMQPAATQGRSRLWLYVLEVVLIVAIGALAFSWWFSNYYEPEYISVNTVNTQSNNKQLYDMLRAESYTLRYSVIGSSSNDDVVVQKSGISVAVREPATGVFLLLKDGVVYDLDVARQTVTVRSEGTAVFDRYLPVLTSGLNTNPEVGTETLRGALYRTENYGPVTAFFLDGKLAYLRRNDSEVLYQIGDYQAEVERGFDEIPDNYTRTGSNNNRTATGSGQVQMDTISVQLPSNDVVGQIGVGEYLIFD